MKLPPVLMAIAIVAAIVLLLLTTNHSKNQQRRRRRLQQSNTTTAADYLAASPDYSLFYRAFLRADRVHGINGSSSYITVLAISDSVLEAWDDVAYWKQVFDERNYALHRQIWVLHHVASGAIRDVELTDGTQWIMHSEEMVVVERRPSAMTLTLRSGRDLDFRSSVAPGDFFVSNGNLRFLADAPLLPEFYSWSDAFALLQNQTELVQFADLIIRAGMEESFDPEVSYTVLAPVDSAFEQGEDLTWRSPEELAMLVQYHMLPHVLPLDALQISRDPLITLSGQNLTTRSQNGTLTFSDTTDSVAHIADNSGRLVLGKRVIIHFIDAVLIPDWNFTLPSAASLVPSLTLTPTGNVSDEEVSYPTRPPISAPTVAPFVTSSLTLGDYITQVPRQYSGLKTLFEAAGLWEQLLTNSSSSLTLLGPDNAALASLDPALVERFLEKTAGFALHLEHFCNHHLVFTSMILTVEEIATRRQLRMKSGETVRIVQSDAATGRVTLRSSQQQQEAILGASNPNVRVTNGIFHGLQSSALLPAFASIDLYDKLLQSNYLSIFASWIALVPTMLDIVRQADITLLAPTNAAFAALPKNMQQSYTNPQNTERLVQLIQNHLLPAMPSTSLVSGTAYKTALGRDLVASSSTSGGLKLDTATVLRRDVLANNGLMHEIDSVLLPPDTDDPWPTGSPSVTRKPTRSPAPTWKPTRSPQPTPRPSISPKPSITYGPTSTALPSNPPPRPTLAELIQQTSSTFLAFRTALDGANMLGQLNDESADDLTVFGPDNEAFAALDSNLVDKLLRRPGFVLHLQGILLYHFANRRITTTELSVQSQTNLTMLNGEILIVEKQQDLSLALSNGEREFATLSPASSSADLIASNGILHQIQGHVLLPSFLFTTLWAILHHSNRHEEDLTIFVNLVVTAGLEQALRRDEEITVLAPNNAAFEALDSARLANLLNNADEARELVQHHVLASVVPSSLLRNTAQSATSSAFATVQGGDLIMPVGAGFLQLGDTNVQILQSDILAKNGILYVIDTVLLEPVTITTAEDDSDRQAPPPPSPVTEDPPPTSAPPENEGTTSASARSFAGSSWRWLLTMSIPPLLLVVLVAELLELSTNP